MRRMMLLYVCDDLLGGELIHRGADVDDAEVLSHPAQCGQLPANRKHWAWDGGDVEFSPDDDIPVTLCLKCERLARDWERRAFASLTPEEHAERAAELARLEDILKRALAGN